MVRGKKPQLSASKEDIRDINPLTNETIVNNLRDRYSNNALYTRIGSNLIVAVNPNRRTDAITEETEMAYLEDAMDTSNEGSKKKLPPHVYEIASKAYLHLCRNGEDQSIILRGISGSGKSFTRDMLIKYLCDLSKGKKKSKIRTGIKNTSVILNAFGNSRTLLNPDASRYGKYTEIQYDNHGKIIGAKLCDYLLEKNRITDIPSNERSYHIFYYLFAGASVEEKNYWRLGEATNYNYIGDQRSLQADDENKFKELTAAMKTVGIGRSAQNQIFQLLTAILQLGNLQFIDSGDMTQEPCQIKNLDVLEVIAETLGIHPRNLETVLTYKTMYIKRELCSVFLNAETAIIQRDSLAKCLYSLLFRWIVEHINNRLCKSEEETANFIGITDFPGFQNKKDNQLQELLSHYMNEHTNQFINQQIFEIPLSDYKSQNIKVQEYNYIPNNEIIQLYERSDGIITVLDSECNRTRKNQDRLLGKINALAENSSILHPSRNGFTIQHYEGDVTYNVEDLLESNMDSMNSDFVSLIRGSGEMPESNNEFIKSIFSDKAVTTQTLKNSGNNIVDAQQSKLPSRSPSTKRKQRKLEKKKQTEVIPTVGSHLTMTMNELFESLSETNPWFVMCIKPNEDLKSYKFNVDFVQEQVQMYGFEDITKIRQDYDYTSYFTFDEFLEIFEPIVESLQLPNYNPRSKCISFVNVFKWGPQDVLVGQDKLFVSEEAWRSLDNEVRAIEDAMKPNKKKTNRLSEDFHGDPNSRSGLIEGYSEASSFHDNGEYSEDEILTEDNMSQFESEYHYTEQDSGAVVDGLRENKGEGDAHATVEEEEEDESSEEEEVEKTTLARKQWVCFTWSVTWCYFPFCLSTCGGMKLKEIQMAWREKVALCIIIGLLSASIIFYIVGLGQIICPKQNVMTREELSRYDDMKKAYIGLHGRYLDVTEFLQKPSHAIYAKDYDNFADYIGKDLTYMFYSPLDLWGVSYCVGVGSSPRDNNMQWDYIYGDKTTSSQRKNFETRVESGNEYLHRVYNPNSDGSGPSGMRKDYVHYLIKEYFKGFLVTSKNSIKPNSDNESNVKYVVIYDNVYDITNYGSANNFLGQFYNEVLTEPSRDVTSLYEKYAKKVKANPNAEGYYPAEACLQCMKDIFFYAKIDHRNDLRCQLTNYILLIGSIILVSVIGVKFLAALRFGGKRDPEEYDKFVICQVPCYTEDDESLRKTIDSLSTMQYDDKRKLLFIIADGMIIGSGNDRPTPRIVLDILGVDASVDPEAFAFHSIGEGPLEYNMGKVYSGLYECKGRSVPFIVVVKVGSPSERSKPGNRGKRDSQMILMRFLSKVHFNSEMTPLELEIYHQMKNVIGVNPSFYEYVLMVDADTRVMKDSLNRMVACMIHDSKIMGICGETKLESEKKSWVTMIQVYEYFISHHLSKAFESLFGSVTCLPGCFSMYRVRTPTRHIPLLISPDIINDYSEKKVDTLHKKNLLSLGEDRYLTTLMLKHFPNLKLTFTPDAICKTNVPDRFSVLLSQRRRWINSTVHNLIELLFLPQLCGFLCFSLRFVVFLDLFATLTQPATIIYLIYLVYVVIAKGEELPILSLLLLIAMYGFQIIIFLIKKQWQHVGWMIIYILALPLYGFYIPLYSFWHFDDFSWGNTRVVLERKMRKKGKKGDIEIYDPKKIPMKKWEDYERELYEQQESSKDSRASDFSKNSFPNAPSSYASSVPALPPQYDNNYAPSMPAGSVYGGDIPNSYYTGSVYAASAYQPSTPAPYNSMYQNQTTMPYPNNSLYSSRPSGVMPSDEEIVREIRQILSTADLMNITKKQVREQLTAYFNVDMSSKKSYINSVIESILEGKM
ncbi:chitin synthase-domain-containing protein [Neocallimastix sp. 'constans']|jgi:chitin synthase